MTGSMITRTTSGPIHSLLAKLSLGPKALRTVAFIAARPGEGTSTIARDYAAALVVQAHQKVLLMLATEPDSETAGIADMLAEGKPAADAIRPLGDGLFAAHWTGRPENRSKAGQWLHTRAWWSTLLDSFDSVIIDIASLQSSADGVLMAAQAEATVLVVAAETTPSPVATHLRNTLTAAGATIAGVVMNKRRYYIPARVYERL